MFENVNGRRRRTDERTPDPWVSYKLTGEPSAQVSLKSIMFAVKQRAVEILKLCHLFF